MGLLCAVLCEGVQYCGGGSFPPDQLSFPTRLYILVLGYALSELVLLLVENSSETAKRADFLEMAVHHIVTIGLTLFSYICGFCKIGALVMYVHNTSDVFIYLSRMTVDFPNSVLVVGCYAMLVRGFLRNFLEVIFLLCTLVTAVCSLCLGNYCSSSGNIIIPTALPRIVVGGQFSNPCVFQETRKKPRQEHMIRSPLPSQEHNTIPLS